MIKLFIDDERQVTDVLGLHFSNAEWKMIKKEWYVSNDDWVIVRNYRDAIDYLKNNPCPTCISFDHDLGNDQTGYDIVKWIIEQDLNQNGLYIPANFEFFTHSQNPIGRENINNILINYLNR